MSTANVQIINNSGRSIDAIAFWHISALPSVLLPGLFSSSNMATSAANLGNGQTHSASVPTTSGSPTDFWAMTVLFHGDGQGYIMTGDTYAPAKEYGCNDGEAVTFTINSYETNTVNQSAIGVTGSSWMSEDETAPLMNPTAAQVMGALVEGMMEALTHA